MFIVKSFQSNWNMIYENFWFLLIDLKMRLLISFFKYWTVSYLQFGYFFVKYAYCTCIELQTRVILDTLHRGEPPFSGKKIIATTSSTKKEWLAILDYTQYTWATDVIIISIFLQKHYYTYQINWMQFIEVIMSISQIE